MLFVGLDDKSSTNRTSRFVKRASPNTAPPNSSSAQVIASQIQYFTASDGVAGNGLAYNPNYRRFSKRHEVPQSLKGLEESQKAKVSSLSAGGLLGKRQFVRCRGVDGGQIGSRNVGLQPRAGGFLNGWQGKKPHGWIDMNKTQAAGPVQKNDRLFGTSPCSLKKPDSGCSGTLFHTIKLVY
jgi:hypothetical protein